MAIRRDLNGKLYTRPTPPQVWYLIDRGKRRGFTSGDVFDQLCTNDGQLIVSADVEGIDEGAVWPSDVEIVYCIENGATFVREGNVLRGIPSEDVMNAYHFKKTGDHGMHLTEILTYPGGDTLEGPLTVLPTSLDHSDNFKETTVLFENHHNIATWITIKIVGADGRVDGKTRIDNVHSEIGWTGGVKILLADVWAQPIYFQSFSPPSPVPGKPYSRYATVNPGETQEKVWTAIYPGLGPRFADLGNVTIMHINEVTGDPFDP